MANRMALWAAILIVARITSAAAPGAAPTPDPAKLAAYEAFALTHEGDPKRGQLLFADEKVTKCVVCHKVAGKGGDVGPDMSYIGGKFDRPHLIESLLDPSRQIVEGYRTTVIVRTDGRVETGIIKGESDAGVTLLDANGDRKTIRAADIEERTVSSASLMPENVADELDFEEFTDLVAYLETLRAGGKPTPGASVAGAIRLPEDFRIETVSTGLTGSTALETLADGRVLVCEQTGALRVVKNGKLLDEPFVVLDVDHNWERGLIGVTVDPNFPQTPYVYVCYVAKEPFPHHRVSRFTAHGDVAVAGSERILLRGDDQTKLGGNVPAGHQGGGIHFGPDRKLYVAIGEQTAQTPSQRLDSLLGKMLRIDPDGTIPKDNPFLRKASGKYRSVWAFGLRNPFTFAFSETGELYANDVGGENEEINLIQRGGNYGWPVVDHGPTDDARFKAPLHYYPQASISGGDFATGIESWPTRYRGKYFFADFVHGWIKYLDPAQARSQRNVAAETLVEGLTRPVDIRFAADGSLYVLLRNAWVIDGKFSGGTGSLMRIRHGRG